MEVASSGKDWGTCGGQKASCSSWRRARAKTGGPVVVRQLVANHGSMHGQRLDGPVVIIQLVAHHGGVHGQRLVDL